MSAKTKTYPLATALIIARELGNLLAPACQRVEVAGSVRRLKKEVHDIDLVIWAIYQRTADVDMFGQETNVRFMPYELMGCLRKHVLMKPHAKIVSFAYRCGMDQIPVELYLAEQDGSNFEALLQMRTGSTEFNLNLVSQARRRGLEYRAGYGLYRGEQRVDDGTEAGIFQALEMRYTPPDRRM
jgi:DNA polymerase/3'-5' exonuclease PolX